MRAKAQIVSAEEAIQKIRPGASLVVSGFVGAGHPELLTSTLEKRFLQHADPQGLTLVYCAGQGDRQTRGLNHLGHEGLLKRVIGGHWNLAPKVGELALRNAIEAYNFPQGVLCCLLREIAAGRPGLITKVGLNTFIDPNQGGGRLNSRTQEELIERVEFDGETYLRYKPFPLEVGFIRATRADRAGSLTMEREGLVGEVLPIAQAVHNCGGIVIAQVEEVVDCIEDPKDVRVPGILVDYIVQASGSEHHQTFDEVFNPDYVRRGSQEVEFPPIELCERKRIGTRALQEIRRGDIVNLGIGLPEMVAAVAAETGRLQEFTLTVESGPIGGIPASGLSFGCSHFPEAIIDQPSQFDFYDGGGLDIAILGAAEVDAQGSVNVASYGGRFVGVGGFANISHRTRRIVFCCTLEAKGKPKFVEQVNHVCFHGPSALARGQSVLFVTENAVFRLTADGLLLEELRTGLNIDEDVLSRMAFRPLVSDKVKRY